MPNAIDTLREALPEEHAYGDDDNGSPFHRADCSLCALADVEALLQAAEPMSRLPYPVSGDERNAWRVYQQALATAVRKVKGEA